MIRQLSWACMSCCVLSPAVWAAETAATAEAVAPSPADEAAQEPAEVVVTAQRRAERLQDVPLSVTAATADELSKAGIVNTQDLTNVVPGLKVDRVAGFTAPAIRGISTQIAQPGADANVAIYLDGIYMPNQLTNTFDLPDIQRVEVSKGPQGTLFGRNATGGAIQIFTLAPSFEPTGRITVGYGSFDDKTINGYVAGPLLDHVLAGSISAYFDKNDGYLHDIIDDKRVGGVKSANVRGKLLWNPTDSASLTFTGFYSRRDDSSNSIAAPLNGNSELASVPGAVLPSGAYNVAYNPAIIPAVDFKTYGGSLRGTLDTDPGAFSVVLAGSRTDVSIDLPASFGYSPGGGTEYLETSPDNNYSAEINFASKHYGPFSFIAGLFAYYDKAGQMPVAVNINGRQSVPDFQISIFSLQDDHSYAGYFEGEYEATDRLTFIAGARYSYERRAIYGGQSVVGQILLDYNPGPLPKIQEKSWSATTPRVSVRYKVTDDSSAYATYSQGFKSGVFNDSTVTDPAVDPERVNAYEIGYKANFAHRFSSNVAAYYYKYKDIQVNAFKTVIDPASGAPVNLQQNLNAASGKIYGAEWDGTAHWTQAFTMSAGLSYLHAKYDRFPNGPSLFPLPQGGNLSTVPLDESGNFLVRSPEFTLNSTGSYAQPLAGGLLDLSATVFYTSRFFFDSQNRIEQPAYTLLNLKASYEIANSGWTVGAFVKNVTDKTYAQGAYLLASGDGIFYAPPRTYGGTIQYAF